MYVVQREYVMAGCLQLIERVVPKFTLPGQTDDAHTHRRSYTPSVIVTSTIWLSAGTEWLNGDRSPNTPPRIRCNQARLQRYISNRPSLRTP